METKKYIGIDDLEVYQFARKLSVIGWDIYNKFDWQTKKVIGDQFITSTDSVGANIAEGYARYHFLDKIKFYYNARGSLSEAVDHWAPLLLERKLVDKATYVKFHEVGRTVSIKLQNFISGTYKAKTESKQ
ncbi:MAG TPA: four helix bundle protein [Candidatus Paceibacterota bacterium]